MSRVLLFFNELSFSFNGLSPDDQRRCIVETILAVRQAREIRSDMDLIIHVPLNKIALGSGTYTLSSLMGNNTFLEEWRFLKSIIHSSTLEECPRHSHPLLSEYALFNGQKGVGLGKAIKNDAFLVSFGYTPWDTNHILAQWHYLDKTGKAISKSTTTRNISKKAHSSHWRTKLEEAGCDFSALSLIHQDADFAARMYPFDHYPSHIHIYKDISAKKCIGILDIKKLVFIECDKSTPRKIIIKWAERNQILLNRNWTRRYKGGKVEKC